MITLIHGDNISESRKLLQTLKENASPTVLTSNELNLTDLSQIFEGTSLFFEQKAVIIEDYLSKTKKSKEKDAILAYLNKQGESHDITFWDNKILTKTQYAGLKNPTERLFKFPQTLFQFLDNIKPHNTNALLTLFHGTIKTTEPELLFYMLVRHFRIMLAIIENVQVEELKRAGDWQLTKYKKQAGLFGRDVLTRHFQKLFEIERKQKTGTLATDLSRSIDFFLLSL
jgi:DNA polymerase III delta subunit